MKRLLSFFSYAVLFAALTSSCNLFIDDEMEDATVLSDFTNVRKHSGEGYDKVVSTTENGCDLEYQFNDNVIVVDEATQDNYITHVESDGVNVMLEVHFRADTPEDLLPQPGEIFLSTITDKFPMGANHLVEKRLFEDGVYKCLMSFATLKDTFKDLHIDGKMTFETDSVRVVVPPAYEDEEAAGARTRAESGGFDPVSIDVGFEGSAFTMSLPMSFSFSGEMATSKGTIHFDASMDKDVNFYKVSNEFNFDNFSLENMKADFTQTVEERTQVELKGGFSKSIPILKDKSIVKGKAITIGPVVLVLFLNVDLSLNFDITGSVVITKHKKYQNIYHFDFYEGTATKEVVILKDQDWSFDAQITGTVSLDLALTVGIGLYGKVLSVRIIPTFTAALTLTVPIASYKASEGFSVYDLSEGGSLKFTLQFSLKVGVFLDLSLKALLGSDDMQKKMRDTKDMLDKLKTSEVTNNQVYQDLIDSEADKLSEDKTMGAYVTFGPWDIIEPKEFTWYPKLDDKSFKIIKSWDKDKNELVQTAQFQLSRLGFWVGLGKQFTPGLMIKKGKSYVTTLFPNEGGKDAKCNTSTTYTFNIPNDNNSQDIIYTAYPCFYERPVTYNQPNAFDKGLSFCNTSPAMTITDIHPTNMIHRQGIFFDNDDNMYEHEYEFLLDTKTSILGISNMKEWYVKEIYNNLEHKYNKSKDNLVDGIYVMHWSFSLLTDETRKQGLQLAFYPQFRTEGNDYVNGAHYSIRLFTDRTYDAEGANGGFDVGVEFAPAVSPDNGGKHCFVKGRLDAIEHEGEIIWQQPDYQKPLPSIISFQSL